MELINNDGRVWGSTGSGLLYHAFNSNGVALCRKNLRPRYYIEMRDDYKTREQASKFEHSNVCQRCSVKLDDLMAEKWVTAAVEADRIDRDHAEALEMDQWNDEVLAQQIDRDHAEALAMDLGTSSTQRRSAAEAAYADNPSLENMKAVREAGKDEMAEYLAGFDSRHPDHVCDEEDEREMYRTYLHDGFMATDGYFGPECFETWRSHYHREIGHKEAREQSEPCTPEQCNGYDRMWMRVDVNGRSVRKFLCKSCDPNNLGKSFHNQVQKAINLRW